jgi:hypothetical protein
VFLAAVVWRRGNNSRLFVAIWHVTLSYDFTLQFAVSQVTSHTNFCGLA